MIHLRALTVISDEELDTKVGKIVTDDDYNVLLTGATTVSKASGQPLAVYLPGALVDAATTPVLASLRSLKALRTDNRGFASGSPRLRYGEDSRTRTIKVSSAVVGAMEAQPSTPYCRQTSWTMKHADKFAALYPMLVDIDRHMQEQVPQRWKNQKAYAMRTDPNWMIPGTVFTTLTVNNTYPTGVHTDKGDLESGFSTLAVFRKGEYSGGVFVLVKYRIGVDMQHGDLLLLDAHEFHGNTAIQTVSEDAERISLVSYFREKMVACDTVEEEHHKAVLHAETRGGKRVKSSTT